jgi:hypothetical protein
MKQKPIRSPKHLAIVRKMDCMIKNREGEHCNQRPVHPHHLTFIDEGGMGEKVGDNYVVPLSWYHHAELHRMGEKAFWEKYGYTLEQVKDYARELWEQTQNM